MKYSHSVVVHNMDAPREIAPFVYNLLRPKSVVDVGCGLGCFTRAFKELGVSKVLGIDGSWCNKELLFENIQKEDFYEWDLEKRINLPEKFDLAVSLEVAEHLSPERATTFVHDLAQLSDKVLFSAAIPGQGGDHHLNEQWLTYWEELFLRHDFVLCDLLRPYFWDNKKVFWWYRQNMVLFVNRKELDTLPDLAHKPSVENIIHPELFGLWTDYTHPNSAKRYVKLLAKSLAHKIGILK